MSVKEVVGGLLLAAVCQGLKQSSVFFVSSVKIPLPDIGGTDDEIDKVSAAFLLPRSKKYVTLILSFSCVSELIELIKV